MNVKLNYFSKKMATSPQNYWKFHFMALILSSNELRKKKKLQEVSININLKNSDVKIF